MEPYTYKENTNKDFENKITFLNWKYLISKVWEDFGKESLSIFYNNNNNNNKKVDALDFFFFFNNLLIKMFSYFQHIPIEMNILI